MSTISLKNLLVPSKVVEVEYPGMLGFKITVGFLSRDTLQTIRKKATKTSFKNREAVTTVDDELFLDLYVKASVKGWSGLTLRYLEQLAPVDVSKEDLDVELEYSEENALYLMKNSAAFDGFISEQVSDLGNFSTNK